MMYCWVCSNTGYIDCDCGGDMCVCLNNGEIECPYCDGGMDAEDEDLFFLDEE